RGTIDKTLFIKKKKSDIMLVQVYVDDIIFGSTKKSMCIEFEDCITFFLGLQVKQQPNGIFISQDKYVADILKKFDFCSIRTATTPIESNKPLVKDEDGVDVDVHVYRSMIGSLMYLTASRPDIMDSPFELEAYSDSDYGGGASLNRKSTTGGCQFLGKRLISWQCKKQTIVENSTTGVRNMNQMMDYGFNFMNTKIHIDNESTISVIKNPVAHSLVDKTPFTMLSLYITAKVAGKPVNISEASIRSDLLFDDADGIDSLHNQAIFDAIQLMGYEGDLTVLTFNKALFSPQWRFLFHTMNHCISSKNQHETPPDPSPRPSPTIPIPDSISKGSGGNHGVHKDPAFDDLDDVDEDRWDAVALRDKG
ncbi:putative ribonuclease H-like domain-containing protein, partial [Tanacetum coccineum]